MRFKRLGAGVLAAALSATSMGIYAYAEEDAAMKQALTYVKQRLDIPEELSDFSYRTSTEQTNTRYNFTWKNKDKLAESISVSIVGRVIKSVYINHEYSEDEWKSSFAKLSDDKLVAAAKKYIAQINPTISSKLEISDDISISLWGSAATLSFTRVENGVPVTGQSGYVNINKNTGELIGYYLNWTNGATFSDKKDAISVKDAQKSYKKLFPLEKVYTLEYDWEKDEYVPHLIYRQTEFGQINAFTGELSTFEDYRSYEGEIGDDDCDDDIATEAAMNDANPGAGGDTKTVTFSEDEIAKLEIENSLIKAEKELEDLRKLGVFYIPKQSEVDSQSCRYDEKKDTYIRDVSFKGDTDRYIDLSGGVIVPLESVKKQSDTYRFYGYFSYDAQTGELLSFSCSAPDVGQNLNTASITKKADEVLKTLLGDDRDKFGALNNTYTGKTYMKYDPDTGKAIGEPRITHMNFDAKRVEYGITCISENVSLNFGNNGYITGYYLNYNKDVTYPKPDKIISKSKAYSQFFKQVELGLRYRCAYDSEAKKVVSALVYAADNNLYIDAFTGKLTNYNGSEIYTAKKEGEYTDLENSKYRTVAEKLRKYGITLMDNKGRLNEDETINAYDFANVMSSAGINVNAKETDSDIIKEDTKITRQLAAYLLVCGKYGSQVADMTSIFKSKFTDVTDKNKYLGYIMIADESGLLKGSGDKFSPKAALTRGAALKVIYDYLSK
jgi:hypothetical protein